MDSLKHIFQVRLLLSGLCAVSTLIGALKDASANTVWPRPTIHPLPIAVTGVSKPVISLNGTWKVTLSPPASFWQNSVDPSSWSDIVVPGELYMQGFNYQNNQEYPYKKAIFIPADFAGKRIIIRFEGVYFYARVWVNGTFVRDHIGGFTCWDCDITNLVTPGQSAWITVGVNPDKWDISGNESGHGNGGILRNVRLFCVPLDCINRVQVETNLDTTYTNAQLKISSEVHFTGVPRAVITFTLTDPSGKRVALSPGSMTLMQADSSKTVVIPMESPRLWDGEHPNLYTLTASLSSGGIVTEIISKKIGFRKIEIVNKNDVRINGKAVKMHGVNHYSTHPLAGRADPEQGYDKKDILLLLNGNINYIRTCHFPATQNFLDMCDSAGIYVEEETAVAFQGAGTTGGTGTFTDPAYTRAYLEQLSEMIEMDRSRPSVFLWSLSNESSNGLNFQLERNYATLEDSTRPWCESYGWGRDAGPTIIRTWHYPNRDGSDYPGGSFSSDTISMLNDECSHVPNIVVPNLGLYPQIRDEWGEAIKMYWSNMFPARGCLGGAIWVWADDAFIAGNQLNGDGRGWGIVDAWRRPKPEYWNVKKAFSPVHITDDTTLVNPGPDKPLSVPVSNWYDCTNLNEIVVAWKIEGTTEKGTLPGPAIAPHTKGVLTIPARNWQDGDLINLRFSRKNGLLLDEYNLPVGRKRTVTFPSVQGPAPAITQTATSIMVKGSAFSIEFSKTTGLITRGIANNQTVIIGGPYLTFGASNMPDAVSNWTFKTITSSSKGTQAVITVTGTYLNIDITYTIAIDANGLMKTMYTCSTHPDIYTEVGLYYVLPNQIDRIAWKRKSLWSTYPADHIGRSEGIATKLRSGGDESLGKEPTWPWSQDMKDYPFFGTNDAGGRGTNDFRAMKYNIWYVSALLSNSDNGVRAESDGSHAAKAMISSDGTIAFSILNKWGNFAVGSIVWMSKNFSRLFTLPNGSYTDSIVVRLGRNKVDIPTL